MNNLRMYICILDWVDPGHAINSAAHAGMMSYLMWHEDPIVIKWLENSFRKVTCNITQAQYDYLAEHFEDYLVITEKAFNDEAVGLVFKPRHEWPKYFQYLTLWGKSYERFRRHGVPTII